MTTTFARAPLRRSRNGYTMISAVVLIGLTSFALLSSMKLVHLALRLQLHGDAVVARISALNRWESQFRADTIDATVKLMAGNEDTDATILRIMPKDGTLIVYEFDRHELRRVTPNSDTQDIWRLDLPEGTVCEISDEPSRRGTEKLVVRVRHSDRILRQVSLLSRSLVSTDTRKETSNAP